MSPPPRQPATPFFKVRTQRLNSPALSGFCAGFETGKWRCAQLARHLTDWLPEFALRHSEAQALGANNAVRLLAQAASTLYGATDPNSRGEIGELLLHAVLREHFGTLPAVSKLFYKDSRNNTVKGFDAVHVVATAQALELWLGEVKFYENGPSAIRAIAQEITAHCQSVYAREEFVLISNKIDDNWPHADRLRNLLDPNTSLDSIFSAACIPALVTYDSDAAQAHSAVTTQYESDLEAELLSHHKLFTRQALPSNVRIHLLLVPLATKRRLVREFDARVKRLQSLS